MVNVELKGIHTVKRKLADGTIQIHYYYRSNGIKLIGEPGTDEFLKSYQEAKFNHRTYAKDTVGGLIKHYQKSSKFTTKRESTKVDYRAALKVIEAKFGDMEIEALDDIKVRGEFKEWRDGMADTPRQADRMWAVLRLVFAVAKDSGLIRWNPAEGGGKLYNGSRAEIIWLPTEISLFIAKAPDHLLGPFLCALHTSQRKGDILRLKWSQFDGSHIKLKQGKTGKNVRVKVHKELLAFIKKLRAAKRKKETASDVFDMNATIFETSRGTPWTDDGYQASFTKFLAKEEVNIKGKRFHDLRGTCITHARRTGSTLEEIASMTGHSKNTVTAILEKHYLAPDQELSDAVILRMERNST